jgi:hypothetical protein
MLSILNILLVSLIGLTLGSTRSFASEAELHNESKVDFTPPVAFQELRQTSLKLIERTGSNQSLYKQLTHQTTGREDRYLKNYRASHLIFENDLRESDPNTINESVRAHATQEAIEMTIGDLEIVRRFRGGLDFKFGLSSFFSSKEKSQPAPRAVPEIRYGLVLESIQTKSDSRYMIAALSSEEEYMHYAQHADTTWTVEKKQKDILDSTHFGRPAYATPYNQHGGWSFWKSLPQFDFVGNAKPKDPNSFTTLLKGSTQVPINYTIGQVDGLYQLETVVPSPTSFKQEGTTHTFSIPFYDTTRFNRVYDEKFDLNKQSILGIKYNRFSALRLNLHQIIPRGQYGSELVFTNALQNWTLSYFDQAKIQKEHVAEVKLDYLYRF